MSSAVACPNCRVRLKVAAPGEGNQSFSCPKCGHVLRVPGLAPAISSGHTGLLLALIGSVILMGGGIIAALVMTRMPALPDKIAESPLAISPKENPEASAKERQNNEEAEKREKDYKLKLQELKLALANQGQYKSNDDKTLFELQKLLDQGDEALGNKQYAAALEIYKLVLQKSPGDARAVKGLVAAQDALSQDQAERKKLEDFAKHMAAGEAAFKAGRYADAIAAYSAALLILPRNIQAAGLQREAERRLAAENNRKDRNTAYDRLIDQAGTALRLLRYEDAIASYKKALEIMPDDTIATKGLADARQAYTNAALQFDVLMARGNSALRDARFKDAIDAFQEAVKLAPANTNAATSLRVAELAYENRAAYLAAMKRGNLALNNLLYNNAVAAFTNALTFVPNDFLATAGLQTAQNGLADYERRRADANLLIQTGNAAAKQRKYADAAKAFKDALRIMPNHPQADALVILFRYNDNMADGTTALNARRFPDAIRHFQAALVEVPNDASATAALNQARAMNKKN